MESIVLLSFSFIHEALVDFTASINNSICSVLNFLFFLLCQTLIVSNIQVSLFGCLFGTMLPDMWSKNFSTGSKDNVSSSMMGHELLSSLSIDSDMNTLALVSIDISFEWLVKSMKNALSDLDSINNIIVGSIESQDTSVVLLTSRSWIDCTLVQNYNVCSVLLQYIGKNINNLGVKLHLGVILVVEVICLWQVSSVVENSLSLLGSSLLSDSDFKIKIVRNWSLNNIRDLIGWNTMRLHANNPVVNGELSFSLLDDLIKFLNGLLIRSLPSFILNFNDLIETFVLWEFSIDSFEV